MEHSPPSEADKSLSQSKNFPPFMELKGSLPHSQQPATRPIPEPVKYTPNLHIPFKIHFNIILPYRCLKPPQVISSLQVS